MQERTPETMSPSEFLEKLSTSGELPEMNTDERDALYDSMSEDDVVRYYQTVRQLGDEKESRVLEQWIPRPKALYHVSHIDNVEVFEPREESKRSESDPPLVFASPIRSVSSMFLLEHSNTGVSGSYDSGKTWCYVAENLDDLKRRNRAGFMYKLPQDAFEVDPYVGLGLFEWTSTVGVAPVSKERVESALEAMMNLGVQVYVPSEEVSMDEFRSGDQAALLDSMRKITLADLVR